ncbi:hypothetical protein QRD02_00945 [Aequorivita sp. SDUM287046]|uniref:Adhesin domain-containing protein n=1 Tax=Aequorivita aurantiaca TaxID=3053356 RepID=A0ABT8DEE3_9FLAO|nr:hypothetical protein [Aequorivita aurantiaca]MDN3722934.1 hypothetical protein [Aequorivita aurantiaca]
MQKLIVILIVFLLGSISGASQHKIIEREYSANGIRELTIEEDAIFKIRIRTEATEKIKITVRITGEHSESVLLEAKFSEEKISLHTGFVPYFIMENDKLAAHKVMAIEMDLILSETISVAIKSTLASVESLGTMMEFSAALEMGNCEMFGFSGNAHLKTVSGNITVFAEDDVSGKAVSKYGNIENELLKNKKFLLEAESMHGNIRLLQTK